MIEPWAALTVLVACTVIVFLAGRWTAPWHPRAVRVVAHHLRLQPDDVVALEVQGPIDAATVELLRQEWARQQCHGKLVLVPADSRVIGRTPPPCHDCDRLRALLGEARGAIALARHATVSYTAKAELADLAARIARELEESGANS